MKLVFIIDNFQDGGGAARVASMLTNAWAERGWDITILSSDAGMGPPCYAFHPAVRLRPLDLLRVSRNAGDALRNNIRRLARLRRAIREARPDLIISFLDGNNILCLLAIRGLGRIPVIISERTDPHERSIGRLWDVLRRLTYPWAECLVTQTEHAMAYFPAALQAKGFIIPNPVLPPSSVNGPWADSYHPTLLSVGSLRQVKGHDLLIRAFASLALEFPSWRLRIVGEGPFRAMLETLINTLGLDGRVQLPGHISSVDAEFKAADLFVLPSRAEGFPNALAEAMAAGLPVVSFDCPSGPGELIRPELDGLLVPQGDPAQLAKALARLMGDQGLRARLAARAPEVAERFAVERILLLWDGVVAKATARITGAPPLP